MKTGVKHKQKSEIKIGRGERFAEEKCPECGGIMINLTNAGMSVTFCIDCNYDDYDYD